jgi:hypothetical protein
VLVLDARYIAQADNTAVSTWTDRSGSGYDFAQATGANQPTLQTGEVGGSPIVRFDGSSDYLARSDTGFPTGNYTFICLSKQNNALTTGGSKTVMHYGKSSTGSALFFLYNEDANFPNDAWGVSSYATGVGIANSTGSHIVASATRNSSDYAIWKNGASKTTKNMTTNTSTHGASGAAVGSFNTALSFGSKLAGDIGTIIYAGSEWSDSLRRKFESAVAYSWKIACS